MQTTILIFGASITQGFWDPEGGWAGRLSRHLMTRHLSERGREYSVFNLGVSGNTSANVLERYAREADARASKNDGRVITIFSVGGNDAMRIHDTELHVPHATFTDTIERLIALAKERSHIVAFVGLTPVDESKTAPLPWDDKFFCRNAYIREYNALIKEGAERNSVLFIDVLPTLTATDYSGLLADGVHPNSDGHQRIFEIVSGALEAANAI